MTTRDFRRIEKHYDYAIHAEGFRSDTFRAYFGCPPHRLRKGRTIQEVERAYRRVHSYAYQEGARRAWAKDPNRQYRMYFFSWAINFCAAALEKMLTEAIWQRMMKPALDAGDEARYPWGKQVECIVNGRSYWYHFVADGGIVPTLRRLSWPTDHAERFNFDEEAADAT